MTLLQLIYRSLTFYWRSHLAVIIGVAICAMVITGTLIVGDSIRSSLETATLLRLGKTDYVFSGFDRFFRASLTENLKSELKTEVAPILQLNGFASAQGGNYRLNNVQIMGIDEQFLSFIPGDNSWNIPQRNEACISENIAQRLQLNVGDAILLRIEKASQIPKNAPFISDSENQISIRLNVVKILSPEELGGFNLKTSQTAPYNIFVSLSFLNEQMELNEKANKILIGSRNASGRDAINTTIRKFWTPADMALEVHQLMDETTLEIRSQRVFMDSSITASIQQVLPEANPILTYMVNSIRKGDRETPYSFMAAGPFLSEEQLSENHVIINAWLADDLKANVGDSLEISYYVIGPLRQLTEESRWFTIVKVVEMEGVFADRTLMPDLPGMSDAGNCREWEAGVPVALDKIRDKDEDYWNIYRGTPKAFISYETGKRLWENRFGVSTAIRSSATGIKIETLEQELASSISPESQGFSLQSVKEDGLTAARGGVDFGQLFMALSFFLLLAGIILMALLFNLHLEKRVTEIGTFKALGFKQKTIKNIILTEGLCIAVPGVILGGILAVIYNKIIFYALNTVWYDIVRTRILEEVILAKTLFFGMTISLVLVSISIWFNVNKRLKAESSSLQKNLPTESKKKMIFWLKAGAWTSMTVAAGMLLYETIFGQTLNTGIFFIAGGLLLLASMLSFAVVIRSKIRISIMELSRKSLILKNLSRNPARSLRIVILFALGTFIIISTGLNKKDLHRGAGAPESGTGGFQFYMEMTIPILKDLNNPEVQTEQGLEKTLSFVQMRRSEGDDASCLNLNRVVSPRILGIPSGQLTGRFSFIKSTDDLDLSAPWSSLEKELPGGVVPAVLDQTVIQWGLGKKVGDTLVYLNEAGSELKLKIIGGLANSIFQGNVLIDEALFLEHFPSNSGSHVFLIDGKSEDLVENKSELERAFRNEGLEIETTADRLAMFNQVENTYLSIFLLLGGLAMILGTIGLGISLARNIQDRSREIGILRAIGFHKSDIFTILSAEHLILLLIGTLTGAATAFIATLPSILSEFVQASWQTAAIIVALIILNGFLWIAAITWNFLNNNLITSLRVE
jgi:putative ABC transport system permease protein